MCDAFEDDGLLSERLIHLVSGYPELYDRSNENHNNSSVKFEIWRAIADSLDIPCEAAMKRWKALRDAYNRSLREIALIKSGRKAKSKCTPYKFSVQMNFLNHHLKKRGKYFSKAYLQERSTPKQEIETFADDGDDLNLSSGDTPKSYVIVHYSPDDDIPDVDAITETHTHGMKRHQDLSDDIYSSAKQPRPSPRTDEDELWLLSLVPVLKRLSGYQKGMAKIKIQQLLLDIEYGDQPKQLDFTTKLQET